MQDKPFLFGTVTQDQQKKPFRQPFYSCAGPCVCAFVRIPSLALGLITCCVRPNALADISTTQSAATANPAGEREIARKTTQTTNPTHTEKNRRIGKKLLFCAPPNRKTSSFALLFTLLAKVGCENTHPHRCAASHALCWQRKSCVFPFRRRDLSSRLTEAWFSKTLSSENTFNFLNGLTSRMFHHREKRGHQKKNHKILYSFGKKERPKKPISSPKNINTQRSHQV